MSKASENGWSIWANGELHPAGTPVIDAEDQGFLLGLAVFDSVLLERGTLLFLEDHLARLEKGARDLGIAWPPPWDPARAFAEAAAPMGTDVSAILRITVTMGVVGGPPAMVVTPRPVVPPPAEGIRVWVSPQHKGAVELESIKSTNRMRNVLAREEAQRHGAWEALLVAPDGDLCEGTISNLFVVHRGRLWTPSTERGCLSGITRERLIASVRDDPPRLEGRPLELVVDRVEPAMVAEADEVFLTNTSGRVLPVVEVLGLEQPVELPGPAGPVARALRARMDGMEEAYRAARAAEL